MLTSDIVLYSNMLWNTDFSGNILYSDWLFYSRGAVSGLSEHFFPTILLLAPFYHIFPNPVWLLFLQSAASAITGILVYVLANDVIKKKLPALLLSFFYLFHPAILGATLDASVGFHHDSLIPPLLLAATLFFYRKNFSGYLISLLLVLGLKESLPILGLIFGCGLVANKKYDRKWYVSTILISVFFICSGLWFYPFLTGVKAVHASNFLNLLADPIARIKTSNIKYWLVMGLFAPAFFASGILFLAMVDMSIYILGGTSPFDWHSFTSSAILIVASIFGLNSLYKNDFIYFYNKTVRSKVIINIFFTIFLISILFGSFVLLEKCFFNKEKLSVSIKYSDIDSIKKLIPPDSTLAVSPDLALFFVNRKHLCGGSVDCLYKSEYTIVNNADRPEFLYNRAFVEQFYKYSDQSELLSKSGSLLLYHRKR